MDLKKIPTGTVIMISGDSTTDCGRGRPYGTYMTGFGDSYVRRIHEAVAVEMPEKTIKFVNAGISGETSRDVAKRWLADCAAVKPDYATLLIGVNDIWRHYDRPYDKEFAVDIDEYEANIRFITEWSVANLKGFTLISPYYFELNRKDTFMKEVLAYSAVCKKVAAEYGAEFIDLQPEIDRLIKAKYTNFFSPDRVHPNYLSHAAIARFILKKWNFR